VKLGIARERRDGERRVAATPETVKQLAGLGLDVLVESRAGVSAGHADDEYREAGAQIVADLDPAGWTSSPMSVRWNFRRRQP
jgi:NAD(P) transhydrogenase subunit alpha